MTFLLFLLVLCVRCLNVLKYGSTCTTVFNRLLYNSLYKLNITNNHIHIYICTCVRVTVCNRTTTIIYIHYTCTIMFQLFVHQFEQNILK